MQRRLLRKLDLEMLLSQIEPHPSPRPSLEQYTIPVSLAATMLYVAAYTNNDIVGKTVLDLGCGTGRLALGAAFLGARQVVGVDIDKVAIETAFENSMKTKLKDKVQWIAADVNVIHRSFDTVLQNPPFGVQKSRADRKFLKKALEVGKSVYSLHKDPRRDKQLIKQLKASRINTTSVSPTPFIERFIEEHNGKIKAVHATLMSIPHIFSFHTKPKHEFLVNLYIIEANLTQDAKRFIEGVEK
ncbi:MAG: METTL5 family protein [Candidatus Bathyarchaeota archaeon]|nr:METTL5 family protein [Candidatus Bathyarchaeota archaeon]MDH5787643.1 METTL5 family protein [Candidatus Bathyarchaeota archaeon]